jgi:hypothetical protein
MQSWHARISLPPCLAVVAMLGVGERFRHELSQADGPASKLRYSGTMEYDKAVQQVSGADAGCK